MERETNAVRVVGEGGKGIFIVAKRRERRDVRSGGLNRKRQRTGNDFTGQRSFPGQKVSKTTSKGAQNGTSCTT
jgi:hypothetical protein